MSSHGEIAMGYPRLMDRTRVRALSPRRTLLRLMVLVALFACAAESSWAIPYFVRKYQVSCSTCHIAPPRLTAFGESFRKLGYRFPGDQEDSMVKDDPVPLGTDGLKRVYPNAIWPSTLPGAFPISPYIGQITSYNRNRTGRTRGNNYNFDAFGEIAGLLAAGTFDESYGYFGNFEFAFGATSVPRSWIAIQDVFGKDLGLNLRFGRFEPELLQVTNFRKMSDARHAVLDPAIDGGKVVGDNEFRLETFTGQKGVEFQGLMGQDTGYAFGVVDGQANGANVANNRKDVYLALSHKFIGEGELGYHMDGTPATTQAASMTPGHNLFGDAASTEVKGFYYNGATTLDAASRQMDNFRILGGDVRVYRDNLSIHGAYVHREDDQPDLGMAFGRTADTWAVQTDYAWFPWLIGSLRHEQHDHQERAGDTASRDFRRWAPTLNYLPRPHVGMKLGGEFVDRSSESGGYRFDRVTFGTFINF